MSQNISVLPHLCFVVNFVIMIEVIFYVFRFKKIWCRYYLDIKMFI